MSGAERGIIPRAIEDVFINIENDAAPHRSLPPPPPPPLPSLLHPGVLRLLQELEPRLFDNLLTTPWQSTPSLSPSPDLCFSQGHSKRPGLRLCLLFLPSRPLSAPLCSSFPRLNLQTALSLRRRSLNPPPPPPPPSLERPHDGTASTWSGHHTSRSTMR